MHDPKEEIEAVLDHLVTDHRQVIARGGGFIVRTPTGQELGPEWQGDLADLQRLWNDDPDTAFRIVSEYDAARQRIRTDRDELQSLMLVVRCSETGISVMGPDPARNSNGAVRLRAQLQADYDVRPSLVRRLLGSDTTEQRFQSGRRGGPLPGRD